MLIAVNVRMKPEYLSSYDPVGVGATKLRNETVNQF